MRFFLATIILSLNILPAFAQTSANPAVQARIGGLAGNYRLVTPCVECDSTITEIKMECNPKCNSGTFTMSKTDIYDMQKRAYDKKTGDWYVLPVNDSAKNDDVLIVVLDMLGPLESYPLFMVKQNGDLFKLNLVNPENFPVKVVKRKGELYITNRHHKAVSLKKAQHYKDYPLHYTYKKQ